MGTQGWSYDDWSGTFYPEGGASGDRLSLYARAFDVVEVDSTFYGAPPRERFVSWRERTPEGFLFTLKMPGEVTHELGLEETRLALRFCEDARALGPKLGPILIQLPPTHGPARMDVTAEFLRALPRELRFAIEFRDREWLVSETLAMLAEVGVTLAVSVGPWLDEESARDATRTMVAETAPGFAYIRWLGATAQGLSASDVVEQRSHEIERWGKLIEGLEVRDVYAFFNNEYQGHSPASARHLQTCLGQPTVAPADLSPQQDLFR